MKKKIDQMMPAVKKAFKDYGRKAVTQKINESNDFSTSLETMIESTTDLKARVRLEKLLKTEKKYCEKLKDGLKLVDSKPTLKQRFAHALETVAIQMDHYQAMNNARTMLIAPK